MTKTIARAAIGALCIAAAATLAPAQTGDYRARRGDAGQVRGPLSDFWFKVRSEWSGYLQMEQGPPEGGGYLQRRTQMSPAPNRVWVSLVRPEMKANGPLAHLYKEFLSEWKKAEGRNWPYAQIFDRPWDRMSQRGRSQNIIMIGTPWSLEPVGPLASRLGFSISPGRIEIGGRRYHGDNLLLILIAPNPENPEKYALVITGSDDEAILQAGHLPYGDTDYVLFRGRRLLESGFFGKRDETAWSPPESWDARGTYHGFAIRESSHYTLWYEPERLGRDEVSALVEQKEAAFESVAALLPGALPGGKITYHLYPSVDRKIDETSRAEVAHVDLASSEIHTVYSRSQRIVEPWLDLFVLLHRSVGPTRLPQLERALAIALAPGFQGRDVQQVSARIWEGTKRPASVLLKTLRAQSVLNPADGPPGPEDLLMAGFLQDLVRRHGKEAAIRFIADASPRDLDDTFRRIFRIDLGNAIDAWAEAIQETFPEPAPVRSNGAPSAGVSREVAAGLDLLRARRDPEAIRALQTALAPEPADPTALAALARLRFRGGEFDAAEVLIDRTLAACAGRGDRNAGCEEAEAWTRLTRGRIEAVQGRTIAAHVDLTHPAVTGGPAPVPTLAEYWLETMGQSRNQLTVVSHLKREARVSLRKLDWREAEVDLKKALEIDPADGEAHRLLSEVYHKQHEYWAWRLRYLNEIHPDYNVLGQTYYFGQSGPVAVRVESLHSLDAFNDLVLKGNLELLKAQSLYAVEIQNLHAEGDRYLIEQQDVQEALRNYRAALDLNRDFFLSHFLVGRCYFLLDRHAEAQESFEEVLARRPADPLVVAWTHTYLGYIALQQEDLRAADREFRKALASVDTGKVAGLARDGLGKVETIRILLPQGRVRR